MDDAKKTKKQLKNELAEMRRRIDELEALETDRMRAKQAIQEAQEFAGSIVDTVHEPLVVLDTDLRVVSASGSFFHTFKVTPEETVGQFIYDLGNHQWDIPKLRGLLEEILSANTTFEGFEVEHQFPIIGRRTMLLSAQRTYRETNETQLILLAIEDITERKRVEEAQKYSEMRYQTIIETLQEGFGIVDLGENIIFVNQAYCDILGYTKDELIGMNLRKIVPEKEFGHILEETEKRKRGESDKYELVMQRKDGKLRDILVSASPFVDEGGEFLGTFALILDITESKRLEKTLNERGKELNCLYGISSLTEKPDISLEEIVQGTVDLIPPSWQYPDITCARIIIEGKEYTTENFRETEWVQTADVTIHGRRAGTVEVYYLEERPQSDEVPFLKEERNLLYEIAERLGKITERKRAEEELVHLSNAVMMSTDSIVISDLDAIIINVNQATLEMYGTDDKKDLIGKSSFELIVPEEREKALKYAREALEKGHVKNLEYHIIAKDGRRIPVEMSTSLMRDSEGKALGFVGVSRDITERKRAEDKLKKTLAELERSNSELEQFASVTSHDLQEPLRMVSSYVQLLAKRYQGKLDKDADDYIAYAVDGANHMQKLISDLLTYSRIGTYGKPFETTDCNVVLDKVLANLQTAIEETGAVVTCDPLPTVVADNSQITQLFQNLISNAIKFHSDDPPGVHVSAERKNNKWVFSVHDNGIGIAPEYHERIFAIFQRLHGREKYPGTGIGLSISKKIVERHGGRIWVESQAGKGSTFHFTIPIRGGEEPWILD